MSRPWKIGDLVKIRGSVPAAIGIIYKEKKEEYNEKIYEVVWVDGHETTNERETDIAIQVISK